MHSFLACGLACIGLKQFNVLVALDGVWVFLHAVSRWCLHRLGMCSVAPKLFYVVADGVCIGWVCALWLQRLFYVDSKGNVKQFFGLFGRFSARWCLGLFGNSLFAAVSRWCLHRLGMCSVAPKLFYVVPDGVCIGWACALWLQRLFYVDSKGNVKQFFGLRFGRFSARV